MSLSLPSIGRDNRYRTIAEIGRGGMAIVYKAEDTLLGRLVAIKIIPPKLTKSKDALRRFIREARAYARLDHPGIIRLYDMGDDDGTQFIVMEYLDGSTLRDHIESRDSIDLSTVQNYFHQICAAIDFAHKKKVVHRDIKPENIMVVDDRVKVMDFGLACLDDFHSQTQAGALMGTIAYFSPEQARGEPGDVRSDIYSLGALLFEMLTNHLPFEATSVTEMIQKHLDAQPPLPSSLNPEVSSAFDRAVLKAMEKDADKRFQTVQEFLDALSSRTMAEKEATAGITPLLAVTTPGIPTATSGTK
ncbi:MAG: serine/threonine protein kinase [Armatimonadetes bacterium]|nr:serine/threonine protein kinase [Armatimonadota bacterium]